jgi:Zn-dependent protease with chaperone function
VDFFGRQERARRRTRWLILIFTLAVVVVSTAVGLVLALLLESLEGDWNLPSRDWIAANAGIVGGMSLAAAGFILAASLFKHFQLGSGGSEVAAELGGEPVLPEDRDPGRRRLQNIVDEMAIAAGIPAPQAYVLEQETAINAFAAGHTPENAAVAVTRGALNRLSRAELQGVIGHEFSHILNGDMRLNTRLIGYLFGILAVSLVGRSMLRAAGHRGVRTGRGAGSAVFFLAGSAVFVLGYTGVLAGRLIQAAVSRQREFLADAAAVQFTRLPEGLAGALRKIAGLPAGSWLRSARAEEVSHMLFAGGRRTLAGLLATHPPIADRLAALGAASMDAPPTVTGAAGDSRPRGYGDAVADGVALAAVPGAVGTAKPAAGLYARALAARVPAAAWESVHRSDLAGPSLLGILLDPDPSIRRRQLGIIGGRLGPEVAGRAANVAEALAATPRAERLALADLAFPALRRQPVVRRTYLRETIDLLTAVDGDVDVFEAMLSGRMATFLEGLDRPPEPASVDRHRQAAAAVTLMTALALAAHADRRAAEAGFRAGVGALSASWPVAASTPLPTRRPPAAALRSALAELGRPAPEDARHLVAALSAATAAGGLIDEGGFALLRAACGTLGLPLPPVVGHETSGTG